MEVHISEVDAKVTKKQLELSLTPILSSLHIETFDIQKSNQRRWAKLTIADASKAQQFLTHAREIPTLFKSPSGRHASFKKGRFLPDPQLIRVLQKEEKDLLLRKTTHESTRQKSKPLTAKLNDIDLSSVECGRWEITSGKNVFTPYYVFDGDCSLVRAGRTLVVNISTSIDKRHNLVIELYSIHSLSLSSIGNKTTLTIALVLAPRIFEEDIAPKSELLAKALGKLSIGTNNKKLRDCNLPNSTTMGTCLTYRLTFKQEIPKVANRVQELTSHQFRPTWTPKSSLRGLVTAFEAQILVLQYHVARREWPFPLRFQIHALWANAVLSPREIQDMLPAIDTLRASSGEQVLNEVLRRLVLQLPVMDATTTTQDGGSKGAIKSMMEQAEFLGRGEGISKPKRDEIPIHRVTVTPTGTYLYGPDFVAANRILRQYRAHQECFIRVLFADEDEEKIRFDREFSNERVLYERFLSILNEGLSIAGEHFDFLGFSHSSLRTQTCWFMRPFVYRGRQLTATTLISELGDFTAIRCPAKCAARIGQAFSESTNAVKVDADSVRTFPDVKVGQYTFTDGCGTMSHSIWRSLSASTSSRYQPTSYQIRYKGAKGMLTLDTTLEGPQVRLRKSMVKFTGSPSDDIEICGTNTRPLPFKLNRQIIKILEDLGIPDSTFEDLQEQAVQKLRRSARSVKSAVEFLAEHLYDSSSGLSTLLKHLQKIRIDVSDDNFVRDILGALLQVQLREIKYRSRILVPDGLTLYGISDETKWLQEGQVFVTFDSQDSPLNGRVAVTRSPALHPGDIQIVQAVTPPEDSSLWNLRNCVVFSQKGSRDLPSMLSGGDLDGDLYNVIYDEALIPRKHATAASYTPVEPEDIGRTVNTNDMTRFFVDFMQNDQLGRIATLHQVFADQSSTSSLECLQLAELHSTAVDFSKSGKPVDIKKIPKTPRSRPDFMAPSASTKVEKGISRAKEPTSPEDGQRYRYYESDRILGKLYRAVDEDIFFQNLEEDSSSIFNGDADDTALGEVLKWAKSQINAKIMLENVELATEVRDYYESNLLNVTHQYTVHRNNRVTEKEVFIGTIIGRSGVLSRYQREQSESMKKRFNQDLRDTKYWMEKQTADREEGLLYLSAACLHHAVEYQSNVDTSLSSFGWFVAAICVSELMNRE